jgi:hypothetical protein
MVEVSGYMGILPLVLAMFGARRHPNRAIAYFWLFAGLLTLLFAFGGSFWTGKLLYHVPIYNKFRAQGRHFIETAFAISVLAGFGVAAIQQRRVTRGDRRMIIGVSSGIMLVSLASFVIFSKQFQAAASRRNLIIPGFTPWTNLTIAIPLALFIIGLGTLWLWRSHIERRWSACLLVAVIALDLGSFGRFIGWEQYSPPIQNMQPSPMAQHYRTLLSARHTRLLSGSNILWAAETPNLFPNLSRLWHVPNASGYSPLLITRVSELMHIDAGGAVPGLPDIRDRGLDLMAVEYALVGTEQDGLNVGLGAGACAAQAALPRHIKLQLPPSDQLTTTVGLISGLGCSQAIPDQQAVLDLKVTNAQGITETHLLRAGRDTAEQAYDCPDVRPSLQHQRPLPLRRTPQSRPGGINCSSNVYMTQIPLQQPQQVRRIELSWRGEPGVITLQQLSLINEPAKTFIPLRNSAIAREHWQLVDPSEATMSNANTSIPATAIYKNQRALPRTWLVPETIPLSSAQVLSTIRTSQLPDGRTYEPRTMALIEDPSGRIQGEALGETDRATVVKIQDTQAVIQTETERAAFLVLSDVNYPGWKATIDGKRTPIFQTNYIQRGVQVPPGKHLIQFTFQPLSFRLGAGVTSMTLVGGIGLILRRYWNRIAHRKIR